MCYVFRLQVYARVRISLAEDYRKGRDFMKSLVHTEELLLSEGAPGAKSLECIDLKSLGALIYENLTWEYI